LTDAIGHSHRRPRGTPRRLLLAAAVLAAGAVAACGSADEHAAIVAQPSAPAASSTSTELPSAHAVEPAAGEDEHSATSAPASTPKAATAGSSTARSDGNAILSPADRASFDRLRAAMGGTHGLAVSALGLDQRVEQLGPLRTAVAWSAAKVPLAMAVIARGGAEAQTANLRGALTASDNAAAMRLWASLGGGQTAAAAADEQLRDGGDAHTSIQYRALRGAGYTPFGQTDWALTDQARFAAGLACSAQGVQVIGFMNQVVSSQRWGLGAAGVPSQFKAVGARAYGREPQAASWTARWACWSSTEGRWPSRWQAFPQTALTRRASTT
jgi:hypothetical protein